MIENHLDKIEEKLKQSNTIKENDKAELIEPPENFENGNCRPFQNSP